MKTLCAGKTLEALELFTSTFDQFQAALSQQNHTLKSADYPRSSAASAMLTPMRSFIAGLSPLALTPKLTAEEAETLFNASRDVLREWVERLRAETATAFPRKSLPLVRAWLCTAGLANPVQSAAPRAENPIRRPPDQLLSGLPDQGRILADRSLSRLLKDDWPRIRRPVGPRSWSDPQEYFE